MTKNESSRSLKDQNRWQLWLTIALNAVVFYLVISSDTIATAGLKEALQGLANLLPVGLALVVTSIANGLLSAHTKARLVFLRWTHALPGHRAFSECGTADPRVDLPRLQAAMGTLPAGPEAENRVWYRLFKEVEETPEVEHIHREFLFMRDYTAFAALFLLAFGAAALVWAPSWKAALLYLLALTLQFLFVRQAAATYGSRFVCTVLAVKSAALKN